MAIAKVKTVPQAHMRAHLATCTQNEPQLCHTVYDFGIFEKCQLMQRGCLLFFLVIDRNVFEMTEKN